MSIYTKLNQLNIVLPKIEMPVAAYAMYTKIDNMIYVSGHISKKNNCVLTGQFGNNITIVSGKKIARSLAIDLLSTLQMACNGNLNQIKRIVKVTGLINSTSNFIEHHLIMNGASELFIEVFENRGQHARSTFGVMQLPMGACMEIELIAQII